MTGVGGFVAPRHLDAINKTGNALIASLDPHDSVGVLDSYFPDSMYFKDSKKFKKYIEEWQYQANSVSNKIHYFSICSPNYLHFTHIEMALHFGINPICEKPLVTNPIILNNLLEMEAKTNNHIYPIQQMRYHPSIMELRKNILQCNIKNYDVIVTYIAPRGNWYQSSWKGNYKKSGGLLMNIGIHFFDILIWLFGSVQKSYIHLLERNKSAGALIMEKAKVGWFLSIDPADCKMNTSEKTRAVRKLVVDGEEVNFSISANNLHIKAYEEILTGNGLNLLDAYPSISLVSQLNQLEISTPDALAHPIFHQ